MRYSVSKTTTGVQLQACPFFLFASLVAHGLKRAAQFRSCTAKKAATICPLSGDISSSRSLRPPPRRYTTPRGQKKARGGGSRDALHVHVPDAPPPQAAVTLYCPMDVDDVPAARGSRPDRLSEVRPQERVLRRTVVQNVDAVTFPTLDVPMPRKVGQLLVCSLS